MSSIREPDPAPNTWSALNLVLGHRSPADVPHVDLNYRHANIVPIRLLEHSLAQEQFTIRGTIVRKGKVKSSVSTNPPQGGFWFEVEDAAGDRVRCVCVNVDGIAFIDSTELGQEYNISNGMFIPAGPGRETNELWLKYIATVLKMFKDSEWPTFILRGDVEDLPPTAQGFSTDHILGEGEHVVVVYDGNNTFRTALTSSLMAFEGVNEDPMKVISIAELNRFPFRDKWTVQGRIIGAGKLQLCCDGQTFGGVWFDICDSHGDGIRCRCLNMATYPHVGRLSLGKLYKVSNGFLVSRHSNCAHLSSSWEVMLEPTSIVEEVRGE